MSDQSGPLATLIERFPSAFPPSLSRLLALVGDQENYCEFVRIVTDLVPERANEILAKTSPGYQISAFGKFFEERYFPVGLDPWGDEENYTIMRYGIQLWSRAMEEEDYESLPQDKSRGKRLIFYMCETSHDGRLALGESLTGFIPPALLEKLPEKGLTEDDVTEAFEHTPYAAMTFVAQTLTFSTGNSFIDVDREMMACSEMPDWDKANAEWWTAEWKKADAIEGAINEMADLVDTDPLGHFKRMLELLGLAPDAGDYLPSRETQIARGQLVLFGGDDGKRESNAAGNGIQVGAAR